MRIVLLISFLFLFTTSAVAEECACIHILDTERVMAAYQDSDFYDQAEDESDVQYIKRRVMGYLDSIVYQYEAAKARREAAWTVDPTPVVE